MPYLTVVMDVTSNEGLKMIVGPGDFEREERNNTKIYRLQGSFLNQFILARRCVNWELHASMIQEEGKKILFLLWYLHMYFLLLPSDAWELK